MKILTVLILIALVYCFVCFMRYLFKGLGEFFAEAWRNGEAGD